MEKLKTDIFYSIQGVRTVSLKIRRSDFICTMTPVTSMAQAREFIAAVSKENRHATHNCWAYIVGPQGNTFHSSDAGEPSGTAGKPMLNMLQGYKMTCVGAVVTRIFGGIKLGIKGLMDAYGQAVQQAIILEPLVKLVFTEDFRVQVPYSFNDKLLHHLSVIRYRIVETRYDAQVLHRVRVEMDDVPVCGELLDSFQAAGWLTFDKQTGE